MNKQVTVSHSPEGRYHSVVFHEGENKLMLYFWHHESYTEEQQKQAKSEVGLFIKDFLSYDWYDLTSVTHNYKTLPPYIKQFVPPSPEFSVPEEKAE